MKHSEKETSHYFQAVSRFFLEHRGAPFFLSAKEVDNIKEWKKMGIPLQVVREGIKECFGAQGKKLGRKGKIFSLSFCRPFVLRSYESFKERKVGSRTKYVRKTDRRKELKNAVEGFLEACPVDSPGIRIAYLRVLDLISDGAKEELFEEEFEEEPEVTVEKPANEETKEKKKE